jgi:hypothetical protein
MKGEGNVRGDRQLLVRCAQRILADEGDNARQLRGKWRCFWRRTFVTAMDQTCHGANYGGKVMSAVHKNEDTGRTALHTSRLNLRFHRPPELQQGRPVHKLMGCPEPVLIPPPHVCKFP